MVLFGIVSGNVHAVLTERREDNAGDPVLELASLWSVAAHDELVEATLGDDRHLTTAPLFSKCNPITFENFVGVQGLDLVGDVVSPSASQTSLATK